MGQNVHTVYSRDVVLPPLLSRKCLLTIAILWEEIHRVCVAHTHGGFLPTIDFFSSLRCAPKIGP